MSKSQKYLITIIIVVGLFFVVFSNKVVKVRLFLPDFIKTPFESENNGDIEAIEILNKGAGMILLQDNEVWRTDIIYVPDISDFSQNKIITTDVIYWNKICVLNNRFLAFAGPIIKIYNLQTGKIEEIPTKLSDINGTDCTVSETDNLVIVSDEIIAFFDGANWDLVEIDLDYGFSITEVDNGKIMLASFLGDVYYLDEANNLELMTQIPLFQDSPIFDVNFVEDGEIIIRSTEGLHLWLFEEDTLEIDLIYEAPIYWDAAYYSSNKFFVTDHKFLWMVENGQSNQLIRWRPGYKLSITAFNFDPWNEILYVALSEDGLYYLNLTE